MLSLKFRTISNRLLSCHFLVDLRRDHVCNDTLHDRNLLMLLVYFEHRDSGALLERRVHIVGVARILANFDAAAVVLEPVEDLNIGFPLQLLRRIAKCAFISNLTPPHRKLS